jgi:hypothetical protein
MTKKPAIKFIAGFLSKFIIIITSDRSTKGYKISRIIIMFFYLLIKEHIVPLK